ncbi:MAG: hypothetical protein ACD_19C00182G0043 [uncultured bacterium]|nr:MAG: hypothetical protein ACD_19C00182G0043 [uncultured bacterium]
MLKIVIDANIIIGCFSSEEDPISKEIIRKINFNEIKAVAPNFLLIEVSNILINKKKLPKDTVGKIINEILGIGIIFKLFATTDILELNEICFKYKITSYDGLYVLLAKKEKGKLVTNDQELLKIKKLTIDLKGFNK